MRITVPCMRVSSWCCSGVRYCFRKVMTWGTHFPGAWTMLEVKVWKRITTDRCNNMAGSVSWASCSRRDCRWLNISCLKESTIERYNTSTTVAFKLEDGIFSKFTQKKKQQQHCTCNYEQFMYSIKQVVS